MWIDRYTYKCGPRQRVQRFSLFLTSRRKVCPLAPTSTPPSQIRAATMKENRQPPPPPSHSQSPDTGTKVQIKRTKKQNELDTMNLCSMRIQWIDLGEEVVVLQRRHRRRRGAAAEAKAAHSRPTMWNVSFFFRRRMRCGVWVRLDVDAVDASTQ